jgi:hypothetical protein
MPTNENDPVVLLLADLMAAATDGNLKVEFRDYETLPERLRAPLAKELARQGVTEGEGFLGECYLATAGEYTREVAVLAALREEDTPEHFLWLVADKNGILGIYDSDEDPTWDPWDPTMAQGRPYLIPIVQKILADGKPRSAEEILEIGIAQGMLPNTMLRKNLYGHLVQYIERTKAHNRKPLIIQNQTDRTFTINQPPDDWPDIPVPEPDPEDPQRKAVIEKLTRTSTGTNPTDFEIAVCEAFEYLGYIAKHIGGELNPDGVIDAPLGPKAYRSMIECKTSVKGLVQGSEFVTEAIKYKDEYHADYCAVIGPKFEQLGTLDAELQTHKVALWTVADLVRILELATNPYEMIPLFDPGRTSNVLDDIEWERRHGRAKRVRTIANVLLEEGWKTQVLAAKEGPRVEAPLLNEDAAMMLVDAWLEKQGAKTGCTRADVRAAFDYLTSPLVARAIYADDARNAIVLCGR